MKGARILPDRKSRRTNRDNADHIYRVIEIVGTSDKSISDAINNAITRAHKTLRNLRWFEVLRTSGHIEQSTPLSGDALGWVYDGRTELIQLEHSP